MTNVSRIIPFFLSSIFMLFIPDIYWWLLPYLRNKNDLYPSVSIIYVLVIFLANLISILIFISFTRKKQIIGKNILIYLLLPSITSSLLSLFFDVIAFFWYIYSPSANFFGSPYAQYIDDALLILVIYRVVSVMVMIWVREREYKKYECNKILINKNIYIDTLSNKIKKLVPINLVIFLSAFSGLASIGFNLSYRRGNTLEIIFNLGSFFAVLSFLLSILVGIFYSKTHQIRSLFVVTFSSLEPIFSSSRASLFAFMLYFLASIAVGKKYPKTIYIIFPFLFIVTGILNLILRGGSTDAVNLTKMGDAFFVINSQIGVLTNVFAFEGQNLSNGIINTVQSILPIPTFILPSKNTSISSLRGFTGVGIPMPVMGEAYFNLGWIGVFIISLFLSYFWGKLEARVLYHLKKFDYICWHHIFFLSGWFYGFVFFNHSGLRRMLRIVAYTLVFLWSIQIKYGTFNQLKNPSQSETD